jgi:hypothetical protein
VIDELGGVLGAGAKPRCYFAPDLTITAGLIVEAPFKHSQDNVIVARYEPLHFSRLAFSQPNTIGLPLITRTGGQAGQDGMNDAIQARVDIEHELTEIGKASRA